METPSYLAKTKTAWISDCSYHDQVQQWGPIFCLQKCFEWMSYNKEQGEQTVYWHELQQKLVTLPTTKSLNQKGLYTKAHIFCVTLSVAILQVILKRFGSKGLRLVVDFGWFPNQPIKVGMIYKKQQKTTTNVKVGHIRKIHLKCPNR